MARQPFKLLSDVEADLDNPPVDKRVQPKQFQPVMLPSGLYIIRLTAGGELPKALEGAYTSITEANKRIAAYQATRVPNAS